MKELLEYPMIIVVAILFIGMIVMRYQRQKERNRDYYSGKKPRSSSRRYLEIETINNRLDKIEVDVAYLKDFTIKQEVKGSPKPSTPIDNKVEIKSELVNLLKKEKKSKKFTDKMLIAEIERKCPNPAYTLSPNEYKKEYKKAYQRLWARKKYNQLK